MMSKEAIFLRLQQLLGEVFELEESRITLASHLAKDLDLDSLDAIELAIRIEVETGITLQEKELRTLRTIADVVDLLYQRLNR